MTTHQCPPDGEGLTPCCRRSPFELPLTDRLTLDEPVDCSAVVDADLLGAGPARRADRGMERI